MPALVTANEDGYSAWVPPQDGYTYQWSISGGAITSTDPSNRQTFRPDSSGVVQLTCLQISPEGVASLPGTAKATIVPAPSIPVITAPAFVTDSQPGYQASVPEQHGCTFAWTISGGTLSVEATTPTVTFTPSGVGPLELSCVALNAAGSKSAPSTFTSASVPPPALPVISGPAYVTAAQAGYAASVPAQPGSTYAWTITGGVLSSLPTESTVTFTPSESGAVQLACVIANAAGTPSAPGTATSTIVPPPQTPVLTTPVFVISNQEVYTASSPRAPGNILTWDMDGGSFSPTFSGDAITFTPTTGTTLTVGCVATNEAGTRSPRAVAAIPIAPPPITPIQHSVRLSSLGATPLGISLNDLWPSARMSVSITNLSDTPLLNPQIYPENAPLAYTFEDITQTLPPASADPQERCEAAWRYIRDHYWHFCSGGSPDPDYSDNVVSIFSSINGYGFGCCDQVARYLGMLFSHLGYPSRMAWMPFHTLCEVYYDGAWHMFDADHRTFYLKRDKVTVASVEDVLADPDLVVLAADENGLDPVGWDARRLADLYIQNGPSLHYGSPGYAPPLPLLLQPRETFTLFRKNQTKSIIATNYDGYPIYITDVTSGLFRWNLPASQSTLDRYCHQVNNLTSALSPQGKSTLQQADLSPGSLTIRRSSPYPLLASQIWVRWNGSPGTISARFSADGFDWSEPISLLPNRQRAGLTHAADLASVVRPRRDYFIRLDLAGGSQVEALVIESHVQASCLNFPSMGTNPGSALHFKDDSQTEASPRILAALEDTLLDNQLQALKLQINATPGSDTPQFQDAPDLLIAPGLDASPSDSRFDFIFNLDAPTQIRKLRGILQNTMVPTVRVNWRVLTRSTPDQSWSEHVSGTQEVGESLEVDTFITAKEVRLLGTATAPIQFRHLAAFGHPPLEAEDAPQVAGITSRTNLRETTTPSAHFLVDGNLSTGAVSGSSSLDHTLNLPSPVQLSKVVLHWGEMGADFTDVTVLGMTDELPTWVRLGTWSGPSSEPSALIPLTGRVNALRIHCKGTRPIGLWEVQVFGTPSAP
jgi:hypothetical protein